MIVTVGSERGFRWDFVRQVLAGIALGIASSIAGVVGFLGVLGWRLRDGADVKPRAADEPSRSTLVVVGSVTTWRIIVAFPEVAYTVAGILGTVAWLKGRAWLAGRQDNTAEDQEEVEPPDIGASLRRLVGDDKGVLLTRRRRYLWLPCRPPLLSLPRTAMTTVAVACQTTTATATTAPTRVQGRGRVQRPSVKGAESSGVPPPGLRVRGDL
ncbi:hypothetical protein [Streptomyces sp. NPDC002962]|uniref:hypothetical protein n=1 Tax=Streptomyces sp. NPDC002962 TaxID=3364674 RepID=UPI0036A3C84A